MEPFCSVTILLFYSPPKSSEVVTLKNPFYRARNWNPAMLKNLPKARQPRRGINGPRHRFQNSCSQALYLTTSKILRYRKNTYEGRSVKETEAISNSHHTKFVLGYTGLCFGSFECSCSAARSWRNEDSWPCIRHWLPGVQRGVFLPFASGRKHTYK